MSPSGVPTTPPGLAALGIHPSLLDKEHFGVAVADTEGNLVYSNPAAITLLGLDEQRGQVPPVGRGHSSTPLPGFSPAAGLVTGYLLGPGQTAATLVVASPTGEVRSEGADMVAHHLLDLVSEEAREGDQPMVSRLLGVLAATLGWETALLWSAKADDLVLSGWWQRSGSELPAALRHHATVAVSPQGALPGRVAALAAPCWMADLSCDPRLQRGSLTGSVGSGSGCGFAVLGPQGLVGVVELLSAERRLADPRLVWSLPSVSTEVAEVLSRWELDHDRAYLLATLEGTRRSQAHLLEASRVLAEATGFKESLERLAQVAVPHFGDLCLIDVVDSVRGVARMAAAHADPAKASLVEELVRDFPPDPAGSHPSVEVIRTGRSRWSPSVEPRFMEATTRSPRHLELTRALGFTSYLAVPLRVRGRVLGSLTLVTAGSDRRFAAEDLALAEELATQVASVVDGARTRDLQGQVNHLLQQSLLPERLDTVSGIVAAARYLSSNEATEVGGDFYDLIPLSLDLVGLAVGDVQGHDMAATTMMGQLRNALRAYAIENPEPPRVLSQLDRFARAFESRMATVCFAILELSSGRLQLASAGHPPPLVLSAHDPPGLVTVEPGPPVGVGTAVRPTVSLEMGPDDLLAFYTDGLVEDRHLGIGAGLERLVEVAGAGPLTPEDLCDHLVAGLVPPGGPEDDVAMLVVQRGGLN